MFGIALPGRLSVLIVSAAILLSVPQVYAANSDVTSTEGWFSVVWGDGEPGSNLTAEVYTLTTPEGKTSDLLITEELARSFGGILALNRKYIAVQGRPGIARIAGSSNSVIEVASLAIIQPPSNNGALAPEGDESAAVSGSKPWVSIMCKFSDYDDEPKNLAYFQGMYSSTKPGLDHYWRELSYNTVNIAGSDAYGWFDLPESEAYYNPTDSLGGTNLSLLANDCIAAADPSVDFSSYAGINMMFNSNFDNGYAWGGSRRYSLDGVTKSFSITWEPPWGYSSITVIAHEMGHGFGLPHSSGMYGQTYDNEWDVMSDSWANCGNSRDATYGCLGQHTIAYHKDMLGWIPADDKFITNGYNATVIIDHLAHPSPSHYRMIKIPTDDPSYYFTVEVRMKSGYDVKLPGKGVIIHEVDRYRSRDANVVDVDNDGDTGDEGAMFIPGETYRNTAYGFSVEVLSETATGFQVAVIYNSFPWNLFLPTLLQGK